MAIHSIRHYEIATDKIQALHFILMCHFYANTRISQLVQQDAKSNTLVTEQLGTPGYDQLQLLSAALHNHKIDLT